MARQAGAAAPAPNASGSLPDVDPRTFMRGTMGQSGDALVVGHVPMGVYAGGAARRKDVATQNGTRVSAVRETSSGVRRLRV